MHRGDLIFFELVAFIHIKFEAAQSQSKQMETDKGGENFYNTCTPVFRN